MTRPRALFLILIVLGVAVGIGMLVAVASSPSSLSPRLVVGTNDPGPTASPGSSAPVPATTGQLRHGPRLLVSGQAWLGFGADKPLVSTDAGNSWAAVSLPAGHAGLVVDPKDHQHMLTGGGSIASSHDSGRTWVAARGRPPGAAPFAPLLVSPDDSSSWFFARDGHLLRTQDSGVSWIDFAPPAPLEGTVMIAAAQPGQFYLASQSGALGFDNRNGSFTDLGSLPQGVLLQDLAIGGTGTSVRLLARGTDGGSYVGGSAGWDLSGAPIGGPIAAAPSGEMLVADGAPGARTTAALYYSTDAGATWHPGSGLPLDQQVGALALAQDGRAYAYCDSGDLYSSSDRGATWSLASSALRAAGA